jgi:hypothetical protein
MLLLLLLLLQVTALGNPMLLERMSAALLEIRSLFREADRDGEQQPHAISSRTTLMRQLA